MSRRLSLMLAAVVLSAPLAGCGTIAPEPEQPPGPPPKVTLRGDKSVRKKATADPVAEQEPVFQFLDQDLQSFRSATEGFNTKSQPSALVAGLTKYSEQLDKANLEPLPEAVREAAEKYREATKALIRALGRLPDHYPGTEFHDALSALFRNKVDDGKKLGGEMVKAVKDYTDALTKMHDAAGSFAVAVEH